jgi:hypothetical protein
MAPSQASNEAMRGAMNAAPAASIRAKMVNGEEGISEEPL